MMPMVKWAGRIMSSVVALIFLSIVNPSLSDKRFIVVYALLVGVPLSMIFLGESGRLWLSVVGWMLLLCMMAILVLGGI
jgi:hypothetical protein